MVLQITIGVATVQNYVNWLSPAPTRDSFTFRWFRYHVGAFLPVPYISIFGVT